MSNIAYMHPVDIPCMIQLVQHHKYRREDGLILYQEPTTQVYFRTDPMKNDGWVNCNPLGVYFDDEQKKHIKNTLTKQGKYINLLLDDEGDIVYEVIVTVCPKDEWYKEEI